MRVRYIEVARILGRVALSVRDPAPGKKKSIYIEK